MNVASELPMSQSISIADDEVQLWTWRYDASLKPIVFHVSADERERAAKLLFEEKRREFLHHRTLLRRILASYVHVSPESLIFAYGPFGKPELRDFPEWRFNLSHTHGAALLGVRKHRAIGVDCESLDRKIDSPGFAELILSPSECTALSQLPAERRAEELLRRFTRKEAFLKTLGCGFSRALSSIELAISGEETELLVVVGPEPIDGFRWHCGRLDDRRYFAVCCEAESNRPLRFSLQSYEVTRAIL